MAFYLVACMRVVCACFSCSFVPERHRPSPILHKYSEENVGYLKNQKYLIKIHNEAFWQVIPALCSQKFSKKRTMYLLQNMEEAWLCLLHLESVQDTMKYQNIKEFWSEMYCPGSESSVPLTDHGSSNIYRIMTQNTDSSTNNS